MGLTAIIPSQGELIRLIQAPAPLIRTISRGAVPGGGGTITAVTATLPITSTETGTPDIGIVRKDLLADAPLQVANGTNVTAGDNDTTISMPKADAMHDGYLLQGDWSNFNDKLDAVAADAPLTGDGTPGDHLGITQAGAGTDGYLSSTDWNTFNNKSTIAYWQESYSTVAPNNTVPAAQWIPASAPNDIDAVIAPKGQGALLARTPDGTSAGGDKRGLRAVDLQTGRQSSYQVAEGNFSGVLSGASNHAHGGLSVVAGGSGGVAYGEKSVVSGGAGNGALADFCAIIGGENLSLIGARSFGYNASTSAAVATETQIGFFNGASLYIANNDNIAREVRFFAPGSDYSTENYTGLKAGAQATSVTYTLPLADGDPNDVLQTDGSGNLSWVANGGSGTTPGAPDTSVQFNSSGAFAGDAGMTYDSATNTLSLGILNTETGTIRLYTNVSNESVSIALNTTATQSWTLRLPANPGSNGYILTTDGTGTTTWIPNVSSVPMSASADITAGVTGYFGADAGYIAAPPATTDNGTSTLISQSGTLKKLYVRCTGGTAPGVGKNIAVKVYKNGVASAITCTVSGTNTSASDLVNTLSVNAGDYIDIEEIPDAGAATTNIQVGLVIET